MKKEVYFSSALVREYDVRELTDSPFDRIIKTGRYILTDIEIQKVRADAEFHGDISGCSGIDHPSSVKAMYRRLYEQLKTLQ